QCFLFCRQSSRLQEDRVGNSDLPNIMQRSGTQDHVDELTVDLHRRCNCSRQLTNPLRVTSSFVVTNLRCSRQALENLDLRMTELFCPFCNDDFETRVLIFELVI